MTGPSIGAAADDVLSDADAVSWRAPYERRPVCVKRSIRAR
ncbi:hypothetical protein ACNKHW_18255 [Shigella flexneri]